MVSRPHRRGSRADRVTKRDVLDWKLSIEATGGRKGGRAKLPTINRKLSAIRSFLRWSQEQGHSPRFDPPKPARRQARPKPRWLEKNEERALVAAVEAANSRPGSRHPLPGSARGAPRGRDAGPRLGGRIDLRTQGEAEGPQGQGEQGTGYRALEYPPSCLDRSRGRPSQGAGPEERQRQPALGPGPPGHRRTLREARPGSARPSGWRTSRSTYSDILAHVACLRMEY